MRMNIAMVIYYQVSIPSLNLINSTISQIGKWTCIDCYCLVSLRLLVCGQIQTNDLWISNTHDWTIAHYSSWPTELITEYFFCCSLSAHLLLYLIQLICYKMNSSLYKNGSTNHPRSWLNYIDVLSHYALVWVSVLTSPRSLQLDFWLLVIALMDLAPLIYSVVQAAKILFTRSY